MCLAVPGEILALDGDDPLTRVASVAFAGIVKNVNVSLLPEARVGDYVLVHAGFAIALLDPAEAERTLEVLGTLGEFTPRPDSPT